MTPNARTRELYRELGFLAEIVETYSPFPKPWGKRHDLCGIFDLIVLKPGEVWGIQATSNAHTSDRERKIQESPRYPQWLALGGKVAVVGWAKRGPRGKMKTWQHKEIILNAESHPPIVAKADVLEGPVYPGVVGWIKALPDSRGLRDDGELG